MSNILEKAIGSGALFPIILTKTSSGKNTWAPVSGDVALIENNLRALFTYHFGEKLRQENFATKLEEALEEPDTQLLHFLVKRFIVEGVNRWEPRVELLHSDVIVTAGKGKMNIVILPTVIMTQNVLNLDFNFTKIDGTYVNN